MSTEGNVCGCSIQQHAISGFPYVVGFNCSGLSTVGVGSKRIFHALSVNRMLSRFVKPIANRREPRE